MGNVLRTLDIYVIILMKWIYLLFSEEMHGVFGFMFLKREEMNLLLRFWIWVFQMSSEKKVNLKSDYRILAN